jgi:hypothetical protein
LFYKNLTDNKTQTNNGTPNINEIKEFWSNIWSNEVQFNNQAEWIPHLENDIPDSNNRHHIQISLEILVKNINSSHNWKSPGGDQIHNFWLKKFTCIHKCLLNHFNGFIREPNTFPEFLAHGITFNFILLDWPPMEPVFCKLLDADTRGSAYCRCVNSVRHTLRFCRQSKLVVT